MEKQLINWYEKNMEVTFYIYSTSGIEKNKNSLLKQLNKIRGDYQHIISELVNIGIMNYNSYKIVHGEFVEFHKNFDKKVIKEIGRFNWK